MKVRTVNFSPDEFLVGVTGLRASEVGFYWVICSLIYSSGGAIPQDDERIFRVLQEPKYKGLGFITSLINKKKLSVEVRDGVAWLVNARCMAEVSAAQTRMQNSRKNGQKGGRPSKDINAVTKPSAETHHYHDHYLSKNNPPTPLKGGNGNGANGRRTRRRNGHNGHEAVGIMVADESKWRARLSSFKKSGAWLDTFGPRPGEPDCQAPAALVSEILKSTEHQNGPQD